MSKQCENVQNNVIDYLLGILNTDDSDQVNKHIHRCPECRQYKQALENENHALMQFSKNVKGNMEARQDKVIHALNDASQMTYTQKLPLWRIIMKNNKTKFAAAVLLIAMLVGISQVGGTRAAFAQTTRFVRTTLAGLKEFVSEMKSRESQGHINESKLPPAKFDKRSSDIQGHIIVAKITEFLVVGKQEALQDFCTNENIEWTLSENNPSMWYARLDDVKTGHFNDFAGSCDDLQLRASPQLMIKEGQEGKVGILGDQDENAVALAFSATIMENNEIVRLSFSFLSGQSGFEIPNLLIKKSEAILFRYVKTADAQDRDAETENIVFVLVQIEARSPT